MADLSQPIQPGNEEVDITFTYAVPDEWRGNTFTKGLTAQWRYHGPRWHAFQIDVNTGREAGWCLLSDREHERPLAMDCVRILVDATASDQNALLCEIANDRGDRDEVDFRFNRQWVVQYQAPPGYQSLYEPTAYCPRDIYDEYNITYDFTTHHFNIPLKDFELEGWNFNLTWGNIRTLRDRMLADCDNKVAPDMPDSAKQPWLEYRQLLRDLPHALAAFSPPVAAHMFPMEPKVAPKGDANPGVMYTGGTSAPGG